MACQIMHSDPNGASWQEDPCGFTGFRYETLEHSQSEVIDIWNVLDDIVDEHKHLQKKRIDD